MSTKRVFKMLAKFCCFVLLHSDLYSFEYSYTKIAITSAFSWQNSISLCPASFHTPRPNLPVTPGDS